MTKCKPCKGKGIYMVQETYGDGDTAIIPYECNHCHGTGQDPNDEDDPRGDFDIGGSSYDDED